MVRQQRGRRPARTAVAVVAVAGIMAGAAGCGGGAEAGDRNTDPTQAVHEAADRLVREGTSQVRTSMEMASGGTRVTIHGEGVYDYRAGRGELTVRLPRDAAGDREHRPITELLAPGALFMKNRGAGVPADKWVRIDTASLQDGNLATGGATDPLTAAELLRGARDVTYVGRGEVLGVATRHYRGTVDLRAAAKAASPGRRATLEAAAKGFGKERVPFDVYLDDEGLVHEIRHRFGFTSGAAGRKRGGGDGDTVVASTTLLYGFGKAVRVRLPEKGDIYAGKVADK
ncbi:hypothetical protein [Streptomyces beihaiensis]|uniref:Lipoprotein n=1 Tax=Streptomyces beihaiensis TaxID=2984495 RepID=A0ABT3TYS0_9ACTN|nr:hypothetical protein [Streptomyces beihaiensis]MCX3062180.1 hypothetical protein [Streptomyces beihaiensis]